MIVLKTPQQAVVSLMAEFKQTKPNWMCVFQLSILYLSFLLCYCASTGFPCISVNLGAHSCTFLKKIYYVLTVTSKIVFLNQMNEILLLKMKKTSDKRGRASVVSFVNLFIVIFCCVFTVYAHKQMHTQSND